MHAPRNNVSIYGGTCISSILYVDVSSILNVDVSSAPTIGVCSTF